MKKMKLLSVLTAALMGLSLTACGSGGNTQSAPVEGTGSQSASPQEAVKRSL